MFQNLMKLFAGRGLASRARRQQAQYHPNTPSGNRGMSPELQRRQIELAQQKRERKMKRANGWFDGGKAVR